MSASFRALGHRQDEGEIAALAFHAFRPNTSAVHLNHHFGNGQAQPHATVFAGQVRFDLVETLENMCKIFFRNSDPIIYDRYFDISGSLFG